MTLSLSEQLRRLPSRTDVAQQLNLLQYGKIIITVTDKSISYVDVNIGNKIERPV